MTEYKLKCRNAQQGIVTPQPQLVVQNHVAMNMQQHHAAGGSDDDDEGDDDGGED